MTRTVLDTNAIVSALLFNGSAPGLALIKALDTGTILVSAALADLRDSGSIEQDADVVMFIHREDVYVTEDEWDQMHPDQEYPKNIAEIIIAKHRKGPTGSILLKFIDNLVRFDSV